MKIPVLTAAQLATTKAFLEAKETVFAWAYRMFCASYGHLTYNAQLDEGYDNFYGWIAWNYSARLGDWRADQDQPTFNVSVAMRTVPKGQLKQMAKETVIGQLPERLVSYNKLQGRWVQFSAKFDEVVAQAEKEMNP